VGNSLKGVSPKNNKENKTMKNSTPITFATCLAVLATIAAMPNQAQAQVTISSLGDLGPTILLPATKNVFVSNDGSTIAGTKSPGYSQQGAYWVNTRIDTLTAGAKPSKPTFGWSSTNLGFLPNPERASQAYGVSNGGNMVVGSSMVGRQNIAFSWTPKGGMVKLTGLNVTDVDSTATGVSGDGSVIVGSRTEHRSIGDGGTRAFRWVGGRITMLGDIPGGVTRSLAAAVSEDGATVVGYGTSAAGEEAFRWTERTGMASLGDLPGGDNRSEVGGDVGSRALGVSADGKFIVGWGTSVNGQEAFRWTARGGMIPLGDLPGGAFESIAKGVSGNGKTVVGCGTSGAGNEAFIWTEGTGRMVTLSSVLAAKGVSLTGWKLISADSISVDGRTIVGWGERGGRKEGFIIKNATDW
jgi:probable HAF family extracellular repeat protein